MAEETCLLLLKDGRSVVCKVALLTPEGSDDTMQCRAAMLLTWNKDKSGRLVFFLEPFPAFISLLVQDWEHYMLPIPMDQIWTVNRSRDVSALLYNAYEGKLRELFSRVDVVSTIPQGLKGRA